MLKERDRQNEADRKAYVPAQLMSPAMVMILNHLVMPHGAKKMRQLIVKFKIQHKIAIEPNPPIASAAVFASPVRSKLALSHSASFRLKSQPA